MKDGPLSIPASLYGSSPPHALTTPRPWRQRQFHLRRCNAETLGRADSPPRSFRRVAFCADSPPICWRPPAGRRYFIFFPSCRDRLSDMLFRTGILRRAEETAVASAGPVCAKNRHRPGSRENFSQSQLQNRNKKRRLMSSVNVERCVAVCRLSDVLVSG